MPIMNRLPFSNLPPPNFYRKQFKTQTYNNYKNINYNNNIKQNTRENYNEKNSITSNNSSNTINLNFPFDLLKNLPSSIGPISFNYLGLLDKNKPVFELMNMQLFLDDIIIICILFFLYNQQVNDEILYILLIMLLFS